MDNVFIRFILVFVGLLLIIFTSWFYFSSKGSSSDYSNVKNFEDCRKFPGSIVQQTFPPVCVMKSGKRLTQDLKISPSNPQPSKVASVKEWPVEAVGVMRASGLALDEKIRLGLKFSDFQVTQLNDATFGFGGVGFDGMYLEDDGNYGEKEGQCVSVSGTVPERFDQFINSGYYVNKQYTYRRSPILVSEMKILSPEECFIYSAKPKETSVSDNNKAIKLTGTIKRGERPAPDISEDYLVVLDKPLKDVDTGAGVQKEIFSLPISFNNLLKLEEVIGRPVDFTATLEWGYAESRYLSVVRILN